jgi:hypothetical protein
MTYEPVVSKANYYARWKAGEFGNKPLQWNSLEDLEASGFLGRVNIRSVVPGGEVIIGVNPGDCRNLLAGKDVRSFRFNENMPDERISIQGEVCLNPDLRLLYSHEKAINRVAMRNARHARGLAAVMKLRAGCDAYSYEWIMDLLNAYPGHVVEFSAYQMPVGNCRKNTIIWETRAY